jgi:hypothetical protein
MEISILTQRNHFLINQAVCSLAERLYSMGCDVTVFRCSATSRGSKSSKMRSARDIFHLMGFWFFVRMFISYLRSIVFFNDRRLSQWCSIVDVHDDQVLDSNFFASQTRESQCLLILSGTRLINKDVLDFFSSNVINVHSSLLPYSKGLMPAYWTFHKKKGRGVTLFRLDEGIDTGEIIYQIPIHNPSDSYMGFLFQTKVIGVDLLVAWVMENLVKFKIPADVPSSYNKYPAEKSALGTK